jgi:hypothetical protein
MRGRASEIECGGLALLALATAVSLAQGQSFAGNWQAGATAMDVAIKSWGQDCGPRPTSTRSAGGGRVLVEQDGQTLIIHSGERRVRSDQCWSPNPAMRRVGTSSAGGVWTTRCKTPAEDPRQEAGTYTLKALDPDRLMYQDVSHFNWKLEQSVCEATITTTQTLLRQKVAPVPATPATGSTATTPVAAQPSTPAVPAPTCTPGPARRLQIRPKQVEIQLGEQVCFELQVLDAKGCEFADASPKLKLQQGKGIKARLAGRCLLAGTSSAESEGTFTVLATQGKARASAQVTVVAASLPSLLTRRLQAVAPEGEAPGETAVAPAQPAEPSAAATPSVPTTRVAARAQPAAPDRSRAVLVIGALVLAAAAGLGLWLVRARPAAVQGAASVPHVVKPVVKPKERRCPKCGTRYPLDHGFCGNDGSALQDVTADE